LSLQEFTEEIDDDRVADVGAVHAQA
jgi:hypothetical protein